MNEAQIRLSCYHCGDTCSDPAIYLSDKPFCCNGCKSVYQLLNQNNLDHYYCLNNAPGTPLKEVQPGRFHFLDEPEIAAQFIAYRDKERTQVTFYLPGIHCSSCLWLLENLNRINPAVLNSRVSFSSKELFLTFLHRDFSLRQVAELLTALGYEPHISTVTSGQQDSPVYATRNTAYKLGITGFCFANIMLISFPEYLGMKAFSDPELSTFFRAVNLLLALPVVFYGAQEFFRNAWYSFRQRYINMDAPIALAITVTFIRSLNEILSGTGPGYLDSLSGIVFFMLLGRALQNRTYSTLRFNRDYQSYFPIAVTVLKDRKETIRSIKDIQEDDLLLLHHQEIVPTDCILSKGKAVIDYSFITGEEGQEIIAIGEIIYAGGKVCGTSIEVIAVKAFSQNSFTQLWNNEIFSKDKSNKASLSENISRYFSLAVLLIAAAAFGYWNHKSPDQAWNAFTAVLIVACPCALLLTTTFTQGHLIRHLSEQGFFVKNARALEQLAIADTIAFDKTGTITEAQQTAAHEEQPGWTALEKDLILSLLSQSIHPLSKATCAKFPEFRRYPVANYKELPGKGIEAWIEDLHIKAGSASFLQVPYAGPEEESALWVSIDGKVKPYFQFRNTIRPGIKKLLHRLNTYNMVMISGDNESSKTQMQQLFPPGATLRYRQSPEQKLSYIRQLQEQGHKVLMVGDGLNDAGALQQSDIGIAVVQHSFAFSPACDAIMDVQKIGNLHHFIHMAKQARKLILAGFGYSLLFNVIGLSFAVRAALSPMIAALLMPASSFGIMLIAYAGVRAITRRHPLKKHDENHIPG